MNIAGDRYCGCMRGVCLFYFSRTYSVSNYLHCFFVQNNEYIQSVARCLQMMLRIDEYRFAFVSVDGISTLLSVLSGRVNFQVSSPTTPPTTAPPTMTPPPP